MMSTTPNHTFFTCTLQLQLCALKRELRFIARTLARLRHRHHILLVCSSVQKSTQLSLLESVQKLLLGDHSLLTSPKHVIVEDIESAPASPLAETDAPAWPELPPRRPSQTSDRQTPTPMKPNEMVSITVDDRCPTTFCIPCSSISTFLALHPPPADPFTTFSLPNTSVADFHDFTLWLRTARILQHPHHDTPWAIEHHAHRLLHALSLGLNLHCPAYQSAALAEFHALGPLLLWPEDYVTPIYSATKTAPTHPARALIVDIVAAKTHGRGKRKVRQGPRDRNVERGDRIQATTFWREYDAVCARRGGDEGESAYPARVAVEGW